MRVDYRRPCKTNKISDNFAEHVQRGSKLPGVDYLTKVGDGVYATAPGTVISATYTNSTASGIYMVVRHRDGRKSYYLHLSKILVGVGRRVAAGQLIAKSGNTGRSTGPHLHFSITDKAGKCVDPQKLIDRDKKPKVEPAETVELPPAPVDAAE